MYSNFLMGSAMPASLTHVYEICPPCSKEYLEQAMKEHEKNETYTIKHMRSSKVLNNGDNYIAEVFRVKFDAKIIAEGVNKEMPTSVLVKRSFVDEQNVPPTIFKFESSVYNNVLIHLEEAFKSKLPVIKCIKATDTIVVTEDFRHGNWTLSKRLEGWNQKHSEQIMKTLGKFHAASIVFSKTNGEKFAEISKHVRDQVYSPENEEICRKSLADSYEITRYMAEVCLKKTKKPEKINAIQRFLTYTSDDMYAQARKATEETPEFAKVFVHGDCWANNIMLNSSEHALLINMATVCLASPARDLVYVFASNPQEVDRKKLIQVYVQELHKHLIEHEIAEDVINQFSIEFIESEVKRLESVALLTAMWLLVPISYTSFPTIAEYNAAVREDKPKLVSKHINKDFYCRRLKKILLEYAK